MEFHCYAGGSFGNWGGLLGKWVGKVKIKEVKAVGWVE